MFSIQNCHWKKEKVSQNQSEFEHFLLFLENLLCNIRNKDIPLTILLGDVNAKSKSWWV